MKPISFEGHLLKGQGLLAMVPWRRTMCHAIDVGIHTIIVLDQERLTLIGVAAVLSHIARDTHLKKAMHNPMIYFFFSLFDMIQEENLLGFMKKWDKIIRFLNCSLNLHFRVRCHDLLWMALLELILSWWQRVVFIFFVVVVVIYLFFK